MTPDDLAVLLFRGFAEQRASGLGDYVEPLTEPFEAGWTELVIDGTFDMRKLAEYRIANGVQT